MPDISVAGPTAEDTAPNALIESDHPRVVALADAVAGLVDDLWRRCGGPVQPALWRALLAADGAGGTDCGPP